MAKLDINSSLRLNSGYEMPRLGYGTSSYHVHFAASIFLRDVSKLVPIAFDLLSPFADITFMQVSIRRKSFGPRP